MRRAIARIAEKGLKKKSIVIASPLGGDAAALVLVYCFD